MARNLIFGDPSENWWCVFAQIDTVGDDPSHVVAFYQTKKEAEEARSSLKERLGEKVSALVFEYRHAKDEIDMLNLMLIDGISMAINYLVG